MREPYDPPKVTLVDPKAVLEGVLRNARKANQMVAELDLMADNLKGRADAFTGKVEELQSVIDSSIRDMRLLEAFRDLEDQAG